MEDRFLDGIFLGMRLRSDEILIGTAREELSRRAHCDGELTKNNGTLNSPSPSKGNLDNLVPEDQQRPRSCSNFGQSRSAPGRRSGGCSSGTTG